MLKDKNILKNPALQPGFLIFMRTMSHKNKVSLHFRQPHMLRLIRNFTDF
mgnify:CR=1 FL=1